jgi:hypothetical protein
MEVLRQGVQSAWRRLLGPTSFVREADSLLYSTRIIIKYMKHNHNDVFMEDLKYRVFVPIGHEARKAIIDHKLC